MSGPRDSLKNPVSFFKLDSLRANHARLFDGIMPSLRCSLFFWSFKSEADVDAKDARNCDVWRVAAISTAFWRERRYKNNGVRTHNQIKFDMDNHKRNARFKST